MIQAVILAAGKGTRCIPLTITRPKALLTVANKTLLEHNLEQLEGLVDEVIIVVGYKGKEIRGHIGTRFRNMRVLYVEQKNQLGTGDALKSCEKLLLGRFVVLNGDDLYSRKDIHACLKYRYAVLTKKVDDPEKWGIVTVKENRVMSIVEKPKKHFSNLANTALYVLDTAIFKHKLNRTKRGEYEATDYISALAQKERVHCLPVSDYWIPVGYPWHIIDANEFFLEKMKKSVIKGTVEKGVTIKGGIFLDEGSVIKSGSYIEGNVVVGKNCVIGPNCYIRGYTSIGSGCKVGNGVEIKNSVLFDNTKVPHLSYVGDSVLGANVNLGAGTITANLRFDHGHVKSTINGSQKSGISGTSKSGDFDGKRMDTGRRKFGCVIGDGAQTGINVSIMPGVKMWPNVTVKPHTVLYEDIKQTL